MVTVTGAEVVGNVGAVAVGNVGFGGVGNVGVDKSVGAVDNAVDKMGVDKIVDVVDVYGSGGNADDYGVDRACGDGGVKCQARRLADQGNKWWMMRAVNAMRSRKMTWCQRVAVDGDAAKVLNLVSRMW